MGHNFGAIVSPFHLDSDVFSDKGAYGERPLSMMCVSDRINPQISVVDPLYVHSVLLDAARQVLAAR